MVFSPTDVGQRIREHRTRAKISLTNAALDLHLSPDYLAKIERGVRHLSIDVLLSISEYYHISVDYILFGTQGHHELAEELSGIIYALQAIQRKL